MVLHTCLKCKMNFNKKSNYLKHLNKKFDCTLIIEQPNIENPPETPILKGLNELNVINNINNNLNNNVINNNLNNCLDNTCLYCGIIMSRKDHLKRHMENNCKVKKIQEQEKENIFKILLAKEEEIKRINEENKKKDEENKRKEEENKKKDEEIKKKEEENRKQIKELQDYIKNLTNMNFDLNNKVSKLLEKMSVSNINNGVINQVNQIIIGKDKLCNFGNEDISKIDTKLFKKVRGKFGKFIFRQCAENIYNNLPNNKTIYISDLSRERAMAFENGDWKLIPMQKAIDTVNEQIRQYFIHNEKHYELLKDPKLKEAYDNEVKRHYKMYYQEYDNEDLYEPPQERLDEFNKVVADELKRFFYDIRDNVKNNYENIKKKIMDSNILKQIEYEPPKRGRGRPKTKNIDPVKIPNSKKKTNKNHKKEIKIEEKKDIKKENKKEQDNIIPVPKICANNPNIIDMGDGLYITRKKSKIFNIE